MTAPRCEECKFHSEHALIASGKPEGRCSHDFAVIRLRVENDVIISHRVSSKVQREDRATGLCGPNGILWEKKDG